MGMSIFKSKKKKTAAGTLQRRVRREEQTGRFVASGALLLRLLMPVFLPALLVGGGCFYLVTADFLAIRTIRTNGCNLIDCEKIAARAGIAQGRNILFADVARTTRLLESDPWIYQAVVKRILPDTIEIQVEERQARAALLLDKTCLIDGHGEVFLCSDQPAATLPHITGLSREYVIANGYTAAQVVDAALSLLGGLQMRGMLRTGTGTHIVIEPAVGLTIDDTVTGIQIFMGLDGFEEKLRLLAFVQGDLAMKGLIARSIHLGTVRQATVRLNTPEIEKNSAKNSKKIG
jgi:cell division protein FtsQ